MPDEILYRAPRLDELADCALVWHASVNDYMARLGHPLPPPVLDLALRLGRAPAVHGPGPLPSGREAVGAGRPGADRRLWHRPAGASTCGSSRQLYARRPQSSGGASGGLCSPWSCPRRLRRARPICCASGPDRRPGAGHLHGQRPADLQRALQQARHRAPVARLQSRRAPQAVQPAPTARRHRGGAARTCGAVVPPQPCRSGPGRSREDDRRHRPRRPGLCPSTRPRVPASPGPDRVPRPDSGRRTTRLRLFIPRRAIWPVALLDETLTAPVIGHLLAEIPPRGAATVWVPGSERSGHGRAPPGGLPSCQASRRCSAGLDPSPPSSATSRRGWPCCNSRPTPARAGARSTRAVSPTVIASRCEPGIPGSAPVTSAGRRPCAANPSAPAQSPPTRRNSSRSWRCAA